MTSNTSSPMLCLVTSLSPPLWKSSQVLEMYDLVVMYNHITCTHRWGLPTAVRQLWALHLYGRSVPAGWEHSIITNNCATHPWRNFHFVEVGGMGNTFYNILLHSDQEYAQYIVAGIKQGFRIGFNYKNHLWSSIPSLLRHTFPRKWQRVGLLALCPLMWKASM